MKLIACGTKVKQTGISGEITGIEIRYTNIVYQFSYWDQDMNYKSIWITRDQFEPDNKKEITIGFIHADNK